MTPTHVHVDGVRLDITELPADDDQPGWDAIHDMAWDWWQQYGQMVRSALAATQAERDEILAGD